MTVFTAGLLLITALFALLPHDGPAGLAVFLFPSAAAIYLVAGLLAWRGRPSSLMGPLILVSGAAVAVAGAGNASPQAFERVGTILATLPLATFVHLLLAFPSGLLRDRVSRFTVVAAYLAATVFHAPSYLWVPTSGMSLEDRPELVALGAILQNTLGAAVLLVTVALLALRLKRASTAERRVLTPLYLYGMLAIAILLFAAHALQSLFGLSAVAVGSVQIIAIAFLPVAFALAVLRGGIARTAEIEELGERLEHATGERAGIAAALAGTLGDPSLEIWFWEPQAAHFLNAVGDPALENELDPHRDLQLVELDGRRIGAIVFDRALLTERELVRTASRVVALALDRERLISLLHASRRDLQRSRERLVEVADIERRRIAQNLHDGLQAELVMLGVEAQQLANTAAPASEVSIRAAKLRHQIDRSAASLRNLVHEVMPAPLIQRGLSSAAEDLTDRMVIPTRLSLELIDGELSPAVESTAYFVLAEALANAVKHSRATAVRVHLQRTKHLLLLEVADNGCGGALSGTGAGLLGMAERLDVLGGKLQVESELGTGTRIKAEVPL